jgi:1-acyl-sn-glycerol-3-phosphate acyltransferase
MPEDSGLPGARLPARKDDWSPTFGNRVFRAFIRPFFRLLFHILCRVKIEGVQNIPAEGGYLVVINHISIFDPPLAVVFWPRAMEIAGAVEVLDRGYQGYLMRGYGALPVHRGTADRKLLRGMVRFLKQGLPVLIAPEGGRTHAPGMRQAWHGAAYVAGKAGVPVVPVGITGTESVSQIWKLRQRPTLRMVIGQPFTLPPIPWGSASRRQALEANTEQLMHEIAELMPPEYRGVYA